VKVIDCNGLAGGMVLGFLQSGFELVYRCGTLDLGAENMENNRRITGWGWTSRYSDDPDEWDTPDADVVVGSPPCSGYSTLTSKQHRGMDAAINRHINVFAQYVSRVQPQVAAFESVQQAYSQGREHMQGLRDKLEANSGMRYDLLHVKHNNLSCGGAAMRKRYFWVVSRIPFGMDPPIIWRVPTLNETIGDLTGLCDTWEAQTYRRPETWWSSRRRSLDYSVDGHATRRLTKARRINALIAALDGEWPQGWNETDAARAVYARHGRLPDEWKPLEERLVANNFDLGINQLVRWRGDRPARVLTGNALGQALHPTENRLLSLREAMRIQGWPDAWRLKGLSEVARANLMPGKGVPVDASRWLAHWVRESIEGRPGSMRGVPVGDREYLFDSTYNYKLAPVLEGRRYHR